MDSRRIEQATLAIFSEARRNWRFASEVIARAFRERKQLRSDERREVAERVYGLIRMSRRIDAVLAHLLRGRGRRMEDFAPADLDSLRYAIYRVTIEGAPLAGVTPLLERFELDPGKLARADESLGTRPGLVLSYPDWLVERVFLELGETEGRALLEALNERAPLCIRANILRTSRETLAARLESESHIAATPTRFAPHGLIVETRTNVFGLRAFREGLFEVQDEASQLISDLVAAPPRGIVVDACAGAGGKSLALGAAMEGKGKVVALDVDARKLVELRRRARRAGLSNVQALDARPGPPALQADRVLVDAPCSGLGVLRRNPEARWRLGANDVEAFPARQRALLDDYAPLVKPGGRLIYATCTFLRSENESVVEDFLFRHKSFRLVPAKEILGRGHAEQVGDSLFLRTWPHRHGTDGFFGAVLRRTATD